MTDDEIAFAAGKGLQDFVDEIGLAHTVNDLGCGDHVIGEFNAKIDKLPNGTSSVKQILKKSSDCHLERSRFCQSLHDRIISIMSYIQFLLT